MSRIDNIYNSILEDSTTTNEEKVDKLYEIHKEIDKINDQDFRKAITMFDYCKDCNKYYWVYEWTEDYKTQKTQRCLNPFAGYLDRYEYEEYEGLFKVKICPCGHCKIIEEI